MKKRTSKVIALLLALTMCIPLGVNAAAATPLSESQTVDNIISAVTQFYYEKDVSGNRSTNSIYTSDVATYLAGKIEAQQRVTALYNTSKENYNVEATLINKTATASKNISSYSFQVVTTYNYVGRDFETTSSEMVEILYDGNSQKIIDFYTPMNYYDEYVRPEQSTLNRSNDSSQSAFRLTTETSNKQKNILSEIDSTYEYMNLESHFDQATPEAVRGVTLNSTAIVNWARSNFNKAQPASGNGSVTYYDFSEISGNYDCTNFVSHAVLAGGANINDTGNSGISATGWYYRNLSNRSSSWSGVSHFYNYMTTNTTYNTAAGQSFQYTLNGAYWGQGDVMQFRFNGSSTYSHSTIITIKERSSDGARCYAYVTGRTSDTQYNNNKAASDMAPVGTQRTIGVYNRYQQ